MLIRSPSLSNIYAKEIKIYNELKNEPIGFAFVNITGTQTGAITDANGKFIINGITPGIYTLTASFVGFKSTISRDVQVTNAKQAYVEIGMQEESQNIETCG